MSVWSGWSDYPFVTLTADLRPMGEGRPEGLHLSDIIRQMKIAEGEKVSDIEGEQPGLRAWEGFVWESALEYMAAGATLEQAMDLSFKRHMVKQRQGIAKQVQVDRDGIHMTPDGLNAVVGESESYKMTRKSFAKAVTLDEFEQNFWPWHVAEMGYCRELGVDTCRFIVLWMAGDYSKGPGTGPKILQVSVTWTADELEENWRRVLKVKEGIASGLLD